MPKTDASQPTQQLGYITVLPDHKSGDTIKNTLTGLVPTSLRLNPEQLFPNFDDLSVTMEKLNHHLQQKPLPGIEN